MFTIDQVIFIDFIAKILYKSNILGITFDVIFFTK